MLMRADNGGVDHDVFEVRVVGHCRKQPIPHAAFGPSGKADEDAVSVAKEIRQIAPGHACSGEPKDCLHKKAIISPSPAGITCLPRQMRLHPLPLPIFQHQSNRRHPTLPEKEIESDLPPSRNPECQRDLGLAP
jgi:hypothetical protein